MYPIPRYKTGRYPQTVVKIYYYYFFAIVITIILLLLSGKQITSALTSTLKLKLTKFPFKTNKEL